MDEGFVDKHDGARREQVVGAFAVGIAIKELGALVAAEASTLACGAQLETGGAIQTVEVSFTQSRVR
jgi:hypothetical protein